MTGLDRGHVWHGLTHDFLKHLHRHVADRFDIVPRYLSPIVCGEMGRQF